jgi:pilus assembly protein CpaB
MRVDVLVTGKPLNRADTETQTVLQNITVVSAGQTIQTDGKSQPITTPVVTLLVTPAEAEALTLSNIEGRIQLVLRNSTDRVTVATHGRRLHELYGAPAAEAPPPVRRAAARPRPPVAPAAPAAAAPPPAPDQMIVIRGAVKKVEVFAREQEAK